MKNIWLQEIKKVLWAALVVAGLFVLVNYQYFGKQVVFWWQQFNHAEQEVVEHDQPNMIYIHSLGIGAPLVYIEELGEPVFQAALAKGVVHYPGTAAIGRPGNAFFFGHSSDFPTKPGNYKTVFALLPQIKIGDEVVLTDDKGVVYRYVVEQTHVVGPKDVDWLQQGDGSQSLLTLQTSYPVGTALKRFLVRGRLVS